MGTNILALEQTSKTKSTHRETAKVLKGSQKIDNQSVRSQYSFLHHRLNPEYEQGVKPLPFRTCLIHTNSDGFEPKIRYVKTQPKWNTDLWYDTFNPDSGEHLESGIYQTNEIRQSNNKRIKRIDAFCSHYKPLYRRGEVSLFFYTLTIANEVETSISAIIDVLKMRLKRRGIKFHDYLWVAEVSENLHFHYHLVVASERVQCKGKSLPAWLMLDDAWGAGTQVQFVKKDVQRYLAKYMSKHNARVIGLRSYGTSMRNKKS